ncbi:hypothetical protein HHS34_005380 [Acidithiobacillus montserratensis]|uniref:Uncharacterized protein n=1 Tax=Acidithiobacillus montserratensis TaxID=2729135 RepID=A0ACD5HIM9_9PROT|nr:hypothetical protein [Acidithiobacillus montserratensis]MBU2746599.1 hypothetical protein [Acidithiobacillus montserratensis]
MKQVLRNGKPCGQLQTVIPLHMHLYCRALAFAQGVSDREMIQACAQGFVRDRPWEHGLRWRTSPRWGLVSELEWTQVTVSLPDSLAKELVAIGEGQNVPAASVLYTMFFWYSWVVYPPLHEKVRRSQEAPCQNSLP